MKRFLTICSLFQALSAVYKILSDESKKSLYDETGEIDEESDGILNDPDRDWVDYWRLLFKVSMITCRDRNTETLDSRLAEISASKVSGEKCSVSVEYPDDFYVQKDTICCLTFLQTSGNQ